MNNNLQRQQAKEHIADHLLSQQTLPEFEELKTDFPYYGYVPEITERLAAGKLQGLTSKNKALFQQEEYFEMTFEEAFMPIFRMYLVDSFVRVRNEYLEKRLASFGLDAKVVGELEPAGQCPCCKYYSIEPGMDGFCEICTVCFWENGGDGPNRMKLEDAQENFNSLGAMEQGALKFIDPEGKMKYRTD